MLRRFSVYLTLETRRVCMLHPPASAYVDVLVFVHREVRCNTTAEQLLSSRWLTEMHKVPGHLPLTLNSGVTCQQIMTMRTR